MPTAPSASPPRPASILGCLAEALTGSSGGGAVLDEEQPGSYRLVPPDGAATPAVIAALAGWLAERDLALGDLRTGPSLEEAYLAITGSRDDAGPPGTVVRAPGDGAAGTRSDGGRRGVGAVGSARIDQQTSAGDGH